MNKMQEAHRDTLHSLLKHLIRVVTHKDDNQMTIESMAIVWGPSLIFQLTIGGSLEEEAMGLREKSRVIEMLLSSYSENENIVSR